MTAYCMAVISTELYRSPVFVRHLTITAHIYKKPAHGNPVYEEPVYEKPVYEKPAYEPLYR